MAEHPPRTVLGSGKGPTTMFQRTKHTNKMVLPYFSHAKLRGQVPRLQHLSLGCPLLPRMSLALRTFVLFSVIYFPFSGQAFGPPSCGDARIATDVSSVALNVRGDANS